MLYLAYGSNLNRDDLDRWSGERELPRIDLGAGEPAFLPDRRLAFTHRSSARGGGVLDVPLAIGHAVGGVMFDLTAQDVLAALDRKEGEGHVYRRIETTALTLDGRERPVFTYEVEPSHREPFVPPPAGYLDVVRRGYEAFGIEMGPLDAASRNERHPGGVAYLFVYGTLMRNEERHPALERHRARFDGVARTAGTLLHLGAYPGLSLAPATAQVVGELYQAPDLGALLAELDRIEGFGGFGVPGSLYRRAIVPVEGGPAGSVPAWTYLFARDPGSVPVIPGGDWRRRQDVP